MKNWGTFLGSQHFGGRKAYQSSGIWIRKNDKQINYSHRPTQTKQHVGQCIGENTFGAWTTHRQTQIHKTHHDPDLGEATTFPLIVLFMLSHGTNTQNVILSQYFLCMATRLAPKCHFVLGLPSWSPEIPKIGTPLTLKAHNFVCIPSIKMRFEAKLQPSLRAFQRYVTHQVQRFPTICRTPLVHKKNQGNSRLLVVGSQFDSLTPNPSFGHNLCFKYPNG